jgi:hypothetical protein
MSERHIEITRQGVGEKHRWVLAGNPRANGPTCCPVLDPGTRRPQARVEPAGVSPGAMARQDLRPVHTVLRTPLRLARWWARMDEEVGPDSPRISNLSRHAVSQPRWHPLQRRGPSRQQVRRCRLDPQNGKSCRF